jgi:hypothetical protein
MAQALTVFDLIWDAISKKKPVLARYRGKPRVLCPHVLGYKNGKEQCLFYQCGGLSNSGLGPVGSSQNWRCIPLDGLDDVELGTGPWITATNAASRPQTCVDQVVVSVSE